MWNPEIATKYVFVDCNEREISSLEIVSPNIQVYLCGFHREQAWNRWDAKVDNGVANVADQVTAYLRNVAHSASHADA